MRLRFAALLLLPAISSAVFAQTVTFELMTSGKPVGKATSTVSKDKHGYKAVTRYHYGIPGSDGDFRDEFKYNDTYGYIEGTIYDEGPSPTTISFVLNKSKTEVTIGRVIQGSQSTDFFPTKANFFLLPPFDPGALQVFLFAATQPSATSIFSIDVPNLFGMEGVSRPGAPAHAAAEDAHFLKGPTVNGTLDGKPVTAHTFLMYTPDFRWIFYADDSNTLLEADLPVAKTTYLRQHWALTDPPVTVSAFGKEAQ